MIEPQNANEEVILRFVNAIATGDLETLKEIIDPAATWSFHGTLPIAGFYEGIDAIINDYLGQGLVLYKPGSLTVELTNMLSAGDSVAIEWHALGESMSGNQYDNEYGLFFKLASGKITSVRIYCDTLHVKDVLYA